LKEEFMAATKAKAKAKKVQTPKATKKAPAAKKAAVVRKPTASATLHREAVAKTWANKEIAARRSVKNKVKVGGVEYRSVLAAFKELDLPVAKHQAFRLELKEKGKARFEGHHFSLSTQ
jgi:hypothetical protein